VYDTIQSIFSPSIRIGTGYKDPRSSRVAIITYNEEATVVADFKKFDSLKKLNKELEKLNSTKKSDSSDALMDLWVSLFWTLSGLFYRN
uniref:VWFA domain-containing protein n=1 Tax=Caenorhabditis tropicalis TaxID=1561998 RepID=A0A1I7SZ46_9PELO